MIIHGRMWLRRSSRIVGFERRARVIVSGRREDVLRSLAAAIDAEVIVADLADAAGGP